jgi:Immunity protein 42
MIIGDTNDFAVEIYHEPSSPKYLGFGRMCIYVQCKRIGNIDEQHCSLFHAVDRITEVAETIYSISDERFTQHTEEEIFAWLDAILYSGDIPDKGEDMHRFNFLNNTGEQFDDSKTFIVCFSQLSLVKIIYKDFEKDTIGSVSCTIGTFQAVSADLRHWFNNQTQKVAYA